MDSEGLVAAAQAKGGGWMDTILNLIPGRRAAASNEPSEEAIRRTHDSLRCSLWRPSSHAAAKHADLHCKQTCAVTMHHEERMPCSGPHAAMLLQADDALPFLHVSVTCCSDLCINSSRLIASLLALRRREKAKGATFFEATEGETVRPMLDVAWAPMLGAFSTLFEEFGEGARPTPHAPVHACFFKRAAASLHAQRSSGPHLTACCVINSNAADPRRLDQMTITAPEQVQELFSTDAAT